MEASHTSTPITPSLPPLTHLHTHHIITTSHTFTPITLSLPPLTHLHTHHTITTSHTSPPSQAPCEAEAQCASMVKAGLVYATATEDMDCLTFGSSVMLRHLTASEAK